MNLSVTGLYSYTTYSICVFSYFLPNARILSLFRFIMSDFVMFCCRKNTSKSIDEVNVNLLKKNDWSIELVAKLLKERDIE